MDPIWDYIIDGHLPDDPKEAAEIRTRSATFTNHKGNLYKRSFFTPILKCIVGKNIEYMLREVHEGICEKSHRSPIVGRKGLETWILLAYNTQRRDRPSQEMQDLPGAYQDFAPNHKSLALPTMGIGHTRTFAPWERSM